LASASATLEMLCERRQKTFVSGGSVADYCGEVLVLDADQGSRTEVLVGFGIHFRDVQLHGCW